jgi:hypothetical protein
LLITHVLWQDGGFLYIRLSTNLRKGEGCTYTYVSMCFYVFVEVRVVGASVGGMRDTYVRQLCNAMSM